MIEHSAHVHVRMGSKSTAAEDGATPEPAEISCDALPSSMLYTVYLNSLPKHTHTHTLLEVDDCQGK